MSTYSDDEIEGIISQLDELEASFTTDGMRPFHALDNARTALRQLLEERRWRPIAEAPKDGRDILLAHRDYTTITLAGWNDHYNKWNVPSDNEAGDMYDFDFFTHFMPLPTPPQDGEA